MADVALSVASGGVTKAREAPLETVYPSRLATLREVPDWLARPHILSGYRVRFAPSLCVKSLFRLHNDTLNVWSHLVPAVALLAIAVGVAGGAGHGVGGGDDEEPLLPPPALPLLLFDASAVVCFSLSAAFHLFGVQCRHSHERLLRCDLGGICGLILGSYLPGIHFAFWCAPAARALYTSVMVLGCAGGAVLPALRWSLRRRQAFYVALVAFAVVPIVHWQMLSAYEPPDVAEHHGERLRQVGGMLAWYAAGGALYFTGFPESRWPGRFDIWFHSHTLWHLCVVAAALSWRAALRSMHAEALTRTCTEAV